MLLSVAKISSETGSWIMTWMYLAPRNQEQRPVPCVVRWYLRIPRSYVTQAPAIAIWLQFQPLFESPIPHSGQTTLDWLGLGGESLPCAHATKNGVPGYGSSRPESLQHHERIRDIMFERDSGLWPPANLLQFPGRRRVTPCTGSSRDVPRNVA